jgi:hypothetical protein
MDLYITQWNLTKPNNSSLSWVKDHADKNDGPQ